MIASAIMFPMVFISGIFIPLNELLAWAQAIAYISPMTYFTDITRACIEGRGHLPMAADLVALLGFSVLCVLLAVRLHRRTIPRRI